MTLDYLALAALKKRQAKNPQKPAQDAAAPAKNPAKPKPAPAKSGS